MFIQDYTLEKYILIRVFFYHFIIFIGSFRNSVYHTSFTIMFIVERPMLVKRLILGKKCPCNMDFK